MKIRNWLLIIAFLVSGLTVPRLWAQSAAHSGDGGTSQVKVPGVPTITPPPGPLPPTTIRGNSNYNNKDVVREMRENRERERAARYPQQAAPVMPKPLGTPSSRLDENQKFALADPLFFDSGDAKLTGWHHIIIRNERGRTTADFWNHNLVTTAGKNYLINAGLAGTITSQAELNPWYLGLLAEQSHQTTGGCSTGTATTLTVGSTVTTVTGEVVTLFGAGASGANLVSAISSGTAGTSQTLTVGCSTTVTNAIVSFGPTLAAADTSASHANWAAIGGSLITNGTWPVWTPVSASAGSTSNTASPAVFTMASASGTVYVQGMFLTSNSALATTSGTIYSEFPYTTGAQVVGNSYTITDTYTITLTFNDDDPLGFLLAKAA